MAIGFPSSGKSTTIEVIAKMLGSKMESQATGEVMQSLLKKTTIPLCWDDPKYTSAVTSVLSGSFDSKGKRTKGRGKEVPLTNVILATNFEMDDDLRYVKHHVKVLGVWFVNLIMLSGAEYIRSVDTKYGLYTHLV